MTDPLTLYRLNDDDAVALSATLKALRTIAPMLERLDDLSIRYGARQRRDAEGRWCYRCVLCGAKWWAATRGDFRHDSECWGDRARALLAALEAMK